MLRELHIQNFAIIQDLTLTFEDGLVVFTGETGAGKSIILDALSAILGERMDSTAIRKGAERAVIEGLFELDAQTQTVINPLLDEEGLLEEAGTLSLGRELRVEGRNIARVNGRSVSLSLLAAIGALLADLHGQSEHLSLLKVRHHLDLLDRFAHHESTLASYKAAFGDWSALQKQLQSLLEAEKTSGQRADMLHYQVQEIGSAKLQPQEEEELRAERTRLANAEALSSLTRDALARLDESAPEAAAVTDLLGAAARDLAELARIDPQTAPLAEQAEDALSILADLAYELRRYGEEIEFNPNRLDEIEERLALLTQLKRKYGGSIQSALNYLESAKLEMSQVENMGAQIAEVEQRITQIKTIMAGLAAQLSDKRRLAAESLQQGVERRLAELGMNSAHFQVSITCEESAEGLALPQGTFAFDSNGIDQVEFLIETNPGEGFKPLVKIASGGETSRLMLALKHELAQADQIPTLVFDEIDSGIGGRIGMTVGKLLWQLGRDHQVLCVTHLPQLAAFGDQHFHVRKLEAEGRTLTQVEELDGPAREHELAMMIGTDSAGTRQSAHEILDAAGRITGKIRA